MHQPVRWIILLTICTLAIGSAAQHDPASGLDPGEAGFARIFGGPAINNTVHHNGLVLSYSFDTCWISARDTEGRLKWELDLASIGCLLLYFDRSQVVSGKFDILFQAGDKKMYLLNSRTGRMIHYSEKDLERERKRSESRKPRCPATCQG